MTELSVTLAQIKAHRPCDEWWHTLTTALGPGWPEDRPIPLSWITETNGLHDALWAICCLPPETARRVSVAFRTACAQRVLPAWTARFPEDTRVVDALATCRAWLRGEATDEQRLRAAKSAMEAGADAAGVNDAAAAHAAYAAWAARAAIAAGLEWAAASEWAAGSAWAATRTCTAWAAEREWQTRAFVALVRGEDPPPDSWEETT